MERWDASTMDHDSSNKTIFPQVPWTREPEPARRRFPHSFAGGPTISWSGGDASPVGNAGDAISVTVARRAELLAHVRRDLETSTGFAIATLNLDHVVKLRNRTDFRAAYRAHDYVVADGNPIMWMSRLAGRQIELIPGSDLVHPLAHLAAEMQAGIALVGTTSDSLAKARAALCRRYPGLNVTGCLSPSRDFDPTGSEADEVIRFLETKKAKLCFLALGAPKQELFAAHARQRLSKVGFVSVGAGLDFLSGTQKRAPRFLRRAAMEWAWRLLRDPGRLATRYLSCAVILPSLAADALHARQSAAVLPQFTLF